MITYQKALLINPKDILALKGVGDINLALAYEAFSLGSVGDVGRYLSEGIRAVDEILNVGIIPHNIDDKLRNVKNDNTDENKSNIKNNDNNDRNNYSKNNNNHIDNNDNNNDSDDDQDDKILFDNTYLSVWKLLGELCTFFRNIGPSDVITLISKKHPTTSCLEKKHSINGLGFGYPLPSYTPLLDILKRGEKAYKKILKSSLLNSGSPSATIYFDIGCSLYSQGIVELQSTGQGSGILPSFSDHSNMKLSDPGSGLKSESSQLFAKAKDFFVKGKSAVREYIYNYS